MANFQVGDHVQWRDPNFLWVERNRYNGVLVEKFPGSCWTIDWDDDYDDKYGSFKELWAESDLTHIVHPL